MNRRTFISATIAGVLAPFCMLKAKKDPLVLTQKNGEAKYTCGEWQYFKVDVEGNCGLREIGCAPECEISRHERALFWRNNERNGYHKIIACDGKTITLGDFREDMY